MKFRVRGYYGQADSIPAVEYQVQLESGSTLDAVIYEIGEMGHYPSLQDCTFVVIGEVAEEGP